MCGIAGWIHWHMDLANHIDVVKQMRDTLAARGPDAENSWVEEHAALAHCRLAVIDIDGGAQPMVKDYCGETYVIVYNGELYNTVELRNKLQGLGHHFVSSYDTEVLLTAFVEWQEQCLNFLNGIFAFAVWRKRARTLFIARDRLGVKPLFYSLKGDSLVFASEIKALLVHPDVEPVLNRTGLAEIIAVGPARTPGIGVFENIFELKPGHYMYYNRSGLFKKQYWQLQSKRHEHTFAETVEHVRELFEDAVRRQLVSDVPLGTLLSGGLDSSVITAYAHKSSLADGLGPLQTFSVDYVDNDKHFRPNEFQPNSDEMWIRRVNEFLGSESHYIRIDNKRLVDALRDAVIARDLPGMADIDSSLMIFSQEIKKHVTVALSGECADEVFGGYPWFKNLSAEPMTMFPWVRNFDERMNIFSQEILNIIQPKAYLERRYREAIAEVPRLDGEVGQAARIREMFYINLTRWMPTLLDRKDRMSMACGLEIRVPFCDHRLIEYVWNVPWEMKYHNQIEKGLLRKALEGILPDDVLYRKKSPYPKTHNPAYLNAMKQSVKEILHEGNSPLLPLLNTESLHTFIDSLTVDSNMPWFGQLMNAPQFLAYLLQMDVWMRHYHVQIKL